MKDASSNIFDVASYIFEKWHKPYITQIELYKLLWFCQGWHFNVREKPLFNELFEAWNNGPVPRELWNIYKGKINLYERDFRNLGDSDNVPTKSKKIIKKVLNHYGKFSQTTLIYLSHQCKPWKNNHNKIPQTIPQDEIEEYFCSL